MFPWESGNGYRVGQVRCTYGDQVGIQPELDHFSYPWLFPRLLSSFCVWALILGVAVICWPLI